MKVSFIFYFMLFSSLVMFLIIDVFSQGYYSFSQKLKFIVRIPFSITAYGKHFSVWTLLLEGI